MLQTSRHSHPCCSSPPCQRLLNQGKGLLCPAGAQDRGDGAGLCLLGTVRADHAGRAVTGIQHHLKAHSKLLRSAQSTWLAFSISPFAPTSPSSHRNLSSPISSVNKEVLSLWPQALQGFLHTATKPQRNKNAVAQGCLNAQCLEALRNDFGLFRFLRATRAPDQHWKQP